MIGRDLKPYFLEANEAPAMCARNAPGESCLDVPCAAWLEEAMVELERMKVTLVRELHEQPSNVLPSMVEGYRVPGGTDGLAATKLGGLEVVLSVADEECNKGGKRAEQSRISSECELWDLP